MSRIRTVKPEFWTSGQVLECSHSARLLFIGLWNFCDDGGVHPAHIRQVKAEIFPGDDVSIAQVQGWMDELIRHRLVVRFSADYQGEVHPFFYVTGWAHQRIDKPSLKYPQYQYVQDSTIIPRAFDDHSENDPRAFDDHSATGVEWKGEERKGREGNGEAQAPTPPPDAPDCAAERNPIIAEPAKPKTKPTKAALPDCPDWLDPNAWQRFVDHRAAKKKPLSPEAAKITLERLEKAKSFGWSPEALIDDAIANGWQGCVYPDKHFQAPPHSKADATPGGGRQPFTPVYSNPKAAMFAEIMAGGAPSKIIEGECHVAH